jgi:hypothetical protein
MGVVVVLQEVLGEASGVGQAAEALGEGRAVLEGLERGLAEGVVVADVGAGVRLADIRPLPFEADNLQAFVASLEGVFLLVLFLRRWRRLGNLVPRRRAPYLAFVTTYSLLFTFAFSNVSNFGILARQRTQLFPLLLVVLAVPHVRRTTASNRDPASIADRVPASQVRIAARAGR